MLFTDITMPKMDGIELLRTVKERWPGISVVMLTCHDDFEFVRRAMEERADDYVLKSEITPEFIGYKLEKVASKRQKICCRPHRRQHEADKLSALALRRG